MSAPEKMNNLTARKRLLIAEATVHRQLIALECENILHHVGRTQEAVRKKRWWLLSGAAVGGYLLPEKWRRYLRVVPLIPDLLRIFRGE